MRHVNVQLILSILIAVAAHLYLTHHPDALHTPLSPWTGDQTDAWANP